MKRYRFRLETVLRVRRIERDRAAAEAAIATREMEAATDEVATRELAYADFDPVNGLRSPKAYLLEQAQRNLQATGVVSARDRRASAAAEAKAAKARLAAAASAVAALEELDARSRGRHERELAVVEARRLDDLVTGAARDDR